VGHVPFERLHERLVRHLEFLAATAEQGNPALCVGLAGDFGRQPGLADSRLPGDPLDSQSIAPAGQPGSHRVNLLAASGDWLGGSCCEPPGQREVFRVPSGVHLAAEDPGLQLLRCDGRVEPELFSQSPPEPVVGRKGPRRVARGRKRFDQ
jgi:hypothetical protein